jgi:hypothetical protein
MKRTLALTSVLIVISILPLACTDQVRPADEQQEVRAALTRFIQAFENGDLDLMEAAFADNAVTFPLAKMSNEVRSQIRTSDYRRVRGLDPQMRQLIARWREGSTDPPYKTIEPKDLEVQMFTDAALVTFHLENGKSLARRTFVLSKEGGCWKIVHLHASNVVGSE